MQHHILNTGGWADKNFVHIVGTETPYRIKQDSPFKNDSPAFATRKTRDSPASQVLYSIKRVVLQPTCCHLVIYASNDG